MKEKLRILFIQQRPCARAYKEAVALYRLGHTIDFVYKWNERYPFMTDYLGETYEYEDYDQLAEVIRLGRWDIVHSHNEPNTPTAVAIRNANCPVVYDCHDVSGLRQNLDGERHETERFCFEHSDGVIMVTTPLCEMTRQELGYTYADPLILPCYCLTDEMPRSSRQKLPGTHIVYEGTLLDAGITPLEYRNYYPFFKKMVDNGIHVHVYCSGFNPRVQSSYIELHESSDLFHFHRQVPYPQLMEEMGQYQWGLVAFNIDDISEHGRRFLDTFMPHKLFEYLFAGACPIVLNTKNPGEWTEKHGVGYYVHSEDEMIDVLLNKKPIPPMEDLQLISLEHHMLEVQDLYYRLLSR